MNVDQEQSLKSLNGLTLEQQRTSVDSGECLNKVSQGMDDDLMAEAKRLVDRVLADKLRDDDESIVTRQLGRFPRGMVAVGARCVCGRPLAVVTRPVLPDGTPFPTTCYLTSPEAVKAASRVEADGSMKDYTDLVERDNVIHERYNYAHRLYLAFRHELAIRLGDSEEHIAGTSAGGMPVRVKCLHALIAQTLVMGEGVNPIGDMVMDRISEEFDPLICRCTTEME
jgi:uncharacterized protein